MCPDNTNTEIPSPNLTPDCTNERKKREEKKEKNAKNAYAIPDLKYRLQKRGTFVRIGYTHTTRSLPQPNPNANKMHTTKKGKKSWID